MSDDQVGCEWVSVSSGTGLSGLSRTKAVKRLCLCVCVCVCVCACVRACVSVLMATAASQLYFLPCICIRLNLFDLTVIFLPVQMILLAFFILNMSVCSQQLTGVNAC